MSYDLMVFDASSAPRSAKEFKSWYEAQTEWAEDHGYDDPAVSAPALRAWFDAIRAQFPAMNGPLAPSDEAIDALEDESVLTDYSIGRTVIYAAFAWSQADAAYAAVKASAQAHGVGFFDASGMPSAVWWPDAQGRLVEAFSIT